MVGVNARTKPQEANSWNIEGLKQNIIDRIRHNVLYLSITKFRLMKIFLLRKLKFNRKAEITGSSQWIAIVVTTNNPPLCLILAITPSKWGPLIKIQTNNFMNIFVFDSLKLYRIKRMKRFSYEHNKIRRSDAKFITSHSLWSALKWRNLRNLWRPMCDVAYRNIA